VLMSAAVALLSQVPVVAEESVPTHEMV